MSRLRASLAQHGGRLILALAACAMPLVMAAESVQVTRAAPLISRKGGKTTRIGVAKPGEIYTVLRRVGKWVGVRLPDERAAWISSAAVSGDLDEGSLDAPTAKSAPSAARPESESKFGAGKLGFAPEVSFSPDFGLGFGAVISYGFPMGSSSQLELGLDALYNRGKSQAGSAKTSVLATGLHVRYGLDLGGLYLAPGAQVIYAIVSSSGNSGAALDFGGTLLGGFAAGPGLITTEVRSTLRGGVTLFFVGGYRLLF